MHTLQYQSFAARAEQRAATQDRNVQNDTKDSLARNSRIQHKVTLKSYDSRGSLSYDTLNI